MQLVESEIQLQRLYDAAEKERANGNAMGAKALFEQIKVKNPAYKNVGARITELEKELSSEAQKNNLASLYEQAVKQANGGEVTAAISAFENLLQQSGGIYKDAKARLDSMRQQVAQSHIKAQLESEYAAGMAALRARDWTPAISSFENVLAADPNFREASHRLREAKNGLKRESTDTILAHYYADGVAAMSKNDLQDGFAIESGHAQS